MSELSGFAKAEIRTVRSELHDCLDQLSELLTGATEGETPGRIEFVVRRLSAAQARCVSALRWIAERSEG